VTLAVVYVCTGDYWRFWQGFRDSAARHLLPGSQVAYFVFTDQPAGWFSGADEVVAQDNLGWPLNTLYRFRMFLRLRDRLREFDRIVFFNANCEFRAPVSAHDLFGDGSDLVACRHPGFFDKPREQFTYERRTQSLACVQQGSIYVAGGLMGGRSESFLAACTEIHRRIEQDFDHGLLALWHDESHWNAYIDQALAGNVRVHLLDPGFLYPEGWSIPFPPRIVLREKSAVIDVHRIKGQPHPQLRGNQAPPSRLQRLARRLGVVQGGRG
jgi:hypothetical protein